ncbi:hypothetical protein [Halodesulfurarchaeum formicicum]|uniref:hypothetical protein n=1 Tax=Halodesulfurarchaeum formicicum TaxID=1873524 RepID=UPI00214FA0DF|nr:hypothetical protein [Halodesulfurarchaeum formicicum]
MCAGRIERRTGAVGLDSSSARGESGTRCEKPPCKSTRSVIALPPLSESEPNSQAFGINDAGTVVGGSATGGQFYAVRWSNTETVEDLGTLRANDAGTIVGTNTVRGPTAGVHAVRWIDDAVEKLGSLAGSDGDSYATDINTQGEIAGSSDRSGEGRTAVVWNR